VQRVSDYNNKYLWNHEGSARVFPDGSVWEFTDTDELQQISFHFCHLAANIDIHCKNLYTKAYIQLTANCGDVEHHSKYESIRRQQTFGKLNLVHIRSPDLDNFQNLTYIRVNDISMMKFYEYPISFSTETSQTA